MLTLNAQSRIVSGKHARKTLSEKGFIPGVVYGPKQETISIELPLLEFKKVLRDAGESSVIELKGLDKGIQVLIHDVDYDPVTNMPRHTDLYAIEKGAKVQVAVQLVFVGESAAVKLGANLVKVMHELEIEAGAADLPHEIEVDISSLEKEGDQIHVSDLQVPHGVTVLADPEEVVALTQALVEESEKAPAEVDMDAIEVESKGKTEEAEAEG